jgi:hypothetical protein
MGIAWGCKPTIMELDFSKRRIVDIQKNLRFYLANKRQNRDFV